MRRLPFVFFHCCIIIEYKLPKETLQAHAKKQKKSHRATLTGKDLFREAADGSKPLSVHALARSSTWTKVFDLNNEGLTEHNYQAYTYDFTVSTIPNFREYNADDYEIETVTFDFEVIPNPGNGSTF